MQNDSLSQRIHDESWESLAATLISMQVDLDKTNKKLRRLRKQMEVVKHVLYEQLMAFNGSETIDVSFFVGTLKTVSRLEKELETNGIKNIEFMIFLKLLLEKIKKQRISAKRPMEMQKEFGKLKKVVEDEDSFRKTAEDRD